VLINNNNNNIPCKSQSECGADKRHVDAVPT